MVKSTFITLIMTIVCSQSFSQDTLINSEEIRNVSEILDISPGLSITGVTDFHERVVDFVTGERFRVRDPSKAKSGIPKYNSVPINEKLFVMSSYGHPDNDIYSVFFYIIGKGARKVISAKYNHPNYPRVFYLNVVSFYNNMLTLYVGYDLNPDGPDYNQIVQISGDWETLGIETLNDFSADLNNDGQVNQLDLLLFQEQWKKDQ